MSIYYKGNTILIEIKPGESNTVTLADGYSFEQIHFTYLSNVNGIAQSHLASNDVLVFPPVNSKSPCVLNFSIADTAARAVIRLVIEKFGQIPDAHYFDKAFDPILITGDDGKEYNVIPSDQFK